MNVIVECGAVPALVRNLLPPVPARERDSGPIQFEHEVEKGSAFTLGLLAIKVISNCNDLYCDLLIYLVVFHLDIVKIVEEVK